MDNHRQEGVEISDYVGPAHRGQQVIRYSVNYHKPHDTSPPIIQPGSVWLTAWSALAPLCTVLMAACWLYGSLLGSWAEALLGLGPNQGESMVGGMGFWLAGISVISGCINLLLQRRASRPNLAQMLSIVALLISGGALALTGCGLWMLAAICNPWC